MASIQNFAAGPLASGSNPQTWSLTVGSGTNRKVVIAHLREAARTYSAVTFNGAAATFILEKVYTALTLGVVLYYYDVPDVLSPGSYTVSVTMSSSASDSQGYAWQLEGVATGAPEDSDSTEIASGTAAIAVTLTSTNGAILLGAAVNASPTPTWSWSGAVTERAEGDEANLTSTVADGTASGAGNQTLTATSSTTAANKVLAGVSIAALSGPSITVQPAADTVILTNESTATFSVTATGTGSLTYDWELETSVGGGSYSNLANGNGATWTGQAAASCTATLTAKTLSGRRVRCNVTDDNGTTTSTAVALTIYDGPQLTTFPATNGSGVSTATLTCDYVTGVGEAIEVRIPLSDGDIAVTVTTT